MHLWRSPTPILFSVKAWLQQAAQGCVHLGFEHRHRWRLHNLSVQHLPVSGSFIIKFSSSFPNGISYMSIYAQLHFLFTFLKICFENLPVKHLYDIVVRFFPLLHSHCHVQFLCFISHIFSHFPFKILHKFFGDYLHYLFVV